MAVIAVITLIVTMTKAPAPFLPAERPLVSDFIFSLEELSTYAALTAEQKEVATRTAAAFFAMMYCGLPDRDQKARQWLAGDALPNERTRKVHAVEEARLAIIGRFLAQAHGYHRSKRTCSVAAEISGLSIESLPDEQPP
jgi:hypothetical protein